jgi:hypothetical protein
VSQDTKIKMLEIQNLHQNFMIVFQSSITNVLGLHRAKANGKRLASTKPRFAHTPDTDLSLISPHMNIPNH